MFQYHGAEHKTIFCYEHGLPLTVENVRVQPRHHPRCGTSFLFVVIVVSILLSSVLFSFIEVTNTFARMGLHLLLLPVIVSLTYEFNRLVGRYDNWFTRIMTAPGLWLQNWTTFEPDDSMIEVGIRPLPWCCRRSRARISGRKRPDGAPGMPHSVEGGIPPGRGARRPDRVWGAATRRASR